jgi:DNA-directed RNA polymerase specialized sigma24 family protein
MSDDQAMRMKLAGRLQAERQDQIAELFDGNYAELVSLAWLLTGDQQLAEDLTQETFVRAYRKLALVRRAESPSAYLRSILVNLVRSSFRDACSKRGTVSSSSRPSPPNRIRRCASTSCARWRHCPLVGEPVSCSAITPISPNVRPQQSWASRSAP